MPKKIKQHAQYQKWKLKAGYLGLKSMLFIMVPEFMLLAPHCTPAKTTFGLSLIFLFENSFIFEIYPSPLSLLYHFSSSPIKILFKNTYEPMMSYNNCPLIIYYFPFLQNYMTFLSFFTLGA